MRIRKINPSINSRLLTLSREDKAKLASLRELFTRLPDPRIPGRVCFPLPEILMIAFCAMLADCNHFTDMEVFACSQAYWLGLFLDLPNGTPSHGRGDRWFLARITNSSGQPISAIYPACRQVTQP
jgi:hypothetical protein